MERGQDDRSRASAPQLNPDPLCSREYVFASNSKVKRGTAIGIVLAWYLAYKLLGAGLGALFS